MATNRQIQHIHKLLPKEVKQDPELKASIVIQFTEDPEKTSTKDLNFNQANQLIESLKGKPAPAVNNFARFDFKNKQHLYMLSLCRQNGWLAWNERKKEMLADLKRLAHWLENTGYLKKPLMKYNEKELPKLVKQFENVVKNTKND